MSKFYSHAIEKEGKKEGSKLLIEHLKEVGESVETSIRQTSLADSNMLSSVGYLIGIAHDFGKYTTFFQKYLLYNERDNAGRYHHGFISALFASYLVEKLIKDKNGYLPLLAYFVVLHHHGDLNALEKDIVPERELQDDNFLQVKEHLRNKLKTLLLQIEDIRKKLGYIESEYSMLLKTKLANKVIEEFLRNWRDVFSRVDRLFYHLTELADESVQINIFITTLLLYSILIDTDKRDAADVAKIKRRNLPQDLVDRYREACPKIDTLATNGMNGLRNEIYTKVTQKILEISLDNHLFTITAPTGSGKTLTAFSSALKLLDRIKKEKGYQPRIIYSLPFVNIIEQNYDIIRKIMSFGIKDFKENETAYLLKHHHLSDLEYRVEDEEKPLDDALLLIESWQSEVIVTTFVQFLHTIIGFKNSFLKKYHNIAGGIILMDEVQNIPIEYWDLVGKVIKLLSTKLGCYIILLTATRPLLFDEKDNAIELVDESEKYFRNLNRVRLKPCIEKKTIDEFIEWFSNQYLPGKSYLVVLNTIASSINIYKKLKYSPIFYLSTNIIPKHRMERIKEISDSLKKGEKPIVVSTQVVEAGVDLDFDMVIRDLGPIDSIIQVAGRCNRNWSGEEGNVYVVSLEDLAHYVYGRIHPYIARQMLEKGEIKEKDFYCLINEYFNIVKPKINDDKSREIWKAMRELRFYDKNKTKTTVSDFEIIKEKGEYIDVFIEIDSDAEKIWKFYEDNVYCEKDFIKRREKYYSIRKEFRQYIISIRKIKDDLLPPIVNGMGYVTREQLDKYYDLKTGYKRIDGAWIW